MPAADALNTIKAQSAGPSRLNGGQRIPRNPNMPDDPEFLTRLASKVTTYIRLADFEEDLRRRSDRVGGNLRYGRHWQISMPRNRAAITANYSAALIDQILAIMTKQDPTFVVSPDDVGDVYAARNMRVVLQRYWMADDMQRKVRNAVNLAESTRTCASKTMWDTTMRGGIGDVTTDIIPGWRMILDPRTRDVARMEFIGDRAQMSRSRAMLLYPDVAQIFTEEGRVTGSNALNSSGSSTSPIAGQFKGFLVDSPSGSSSGGTIVNGKPVVTAFTSRSPSASNSEFEVEIVELYHRDRTLVTKMVPAKDEFGRPRREIARDESGAPQFTQDGEYDDVLGEPGYKLVYRDVLEPKRVPKYPKYRRTTMLYPEGRVIDDRAWDHPVPYAIFMANEPLEGPHGRGTILMLEDLQSCLNVSLSTMMDNLRFSSYRAFKAASNVNLEKNNLVISPGDVIRVGQDVAQFVPLEFPEVSPAWFQWVQFVMGLMDKIAGVEGIMQGSAKDAPRTDSAKGFDALAEIGGSRIVEKTQRLETFISQIGEKVGYWAQKNYTDEHALAIENLEGELTWERATNTQLAGTFSYTVAVGSTLAWNASAIRDRVMAEYAAGLRDKISVFRQLENTTAAIPDWREIMQRVKTDPTAGMPPPPRTRGPAPKQPRTPKSAA